ncbi:MAG: porin family protein [Epsilonproteobacteria bacterium]|nr:porin family protein [Campylobacterota bacterium]
MKITLALSALLLSSTFTFAGGGKNLVKAVEPVLAIPTLEVVKDYYVGVGYSCAQVTGDNPDQEFLAMGAISVDVGYQINEFLAVEARYTRSLSDINYKTWNTDRDLDGSSLSNLGIYLKPQYNFEAFGLYGLLGYGQVKLDNGENTFTENGLQYGLGTTFTVLGTNIFLDYRRLYDGEGFDTLASENQDVAANSYTLGVNYLF